MYPNFNTSFLATLISIACAGHLLQSANGFPNAHTASAYQNNNHHHNHHHNNDDNDDNNNDNLINIELPLSPSIQSPTRITYIDDNSQFQTLHSDNLNNDHDESTIDNVDTSVSDQDNILSSQYNSESYINSVLRPSHHNVVDNSEYNTLLTNQAVLPSTRPTHIPFNSLLKRLSQLLERRRRRERRIQSFRQAILRGTGRSRQASHRGNLNHHASNSVVSRRLALQALRRRIAY